MASDAAGAICVASAAAGPIWVASEAAGAISVAPAAAGPSCVAAPAAATPKPSADCAAPRAIAKPGSGGTATGLVETSSAATESRSNRWPTSMTLVVASGACASTVAHATATPAEPMGSDASTAVDSPSSATAVSATVSSSASSRAASAPRLRATAVAASASVTTSTFCTPAFDTVRRSVSACDASGMHSRVAAT
ncbi:hypothetical protein DVS77_18555 [Mycolicibacterium moriokaense]|nr:hypothetical protein DVS77_18555 [Mycolicibacterium moriokaense]